MYIHEYMQTKVITVSSNALVPEAEKLMQEHNIRRLPVVDHGKLKGLVTQKDLLKLKPSPASYSSKFDATYIVANILVKDMMVKANDLITITPDTTIEDAINLGQEHQVGVLLVVDKEDGEKLVSIITITDLFKLMVQAFGFGKKGARLHFFDCPGGHCQEEILHLIFSDGVHIKSLVQVNVLETGREDTIIQLDTDDATEIIEQVTARGYSVEAR